MRIPEPPAQKFHRRARMPYPGCLNVRTVGSLRHPSLRHPATFPLRDQDALAEVVAQDTLAEIVAPGQRSKCRGYAGDAVGRLEQKKALSQDAFTNRRMVGLGRSSACQATRQISKSRIPPSQRCDLTS